MLPGGSNRRRHLIVTSSGELKHVWLIPWQQLRRRCPADTGRCVRIPGHRLYKRRFAAAFDLYNQMIPVQERQGTPDEVIKQFQYARDRRVQGLCHFEDYHFVARMASGVCGYMQLFYNPVENFSFVGFLVVRAGISLGKQTAWVTSRVCQEITCKLAFENGFRACDRVFLELDDPGRAADERTRRRSARRISRFEAICKQCGRELRLLDFDYLQARLGLPADWSGAERPHLLGYISKRD